MHKILFVFLLFLYTVAASDISVDSISNSTVKDVDHHIVSGWHLPFAWFSVFIVGSGTTVTLALMFWTAHKKRKPFNTKHWPLLAVQAVTGYATMFVPLKDIFGRPLCSTQYMMSRLATVLHLGPLVILSIWVWYVLTTELQKVVVARGDPKIVKAFVRKKKLFSSWAILIQLSFLCSPPLLASIVDSARSDKNIAEIDICADLSENSKTTSLITYIFYTLCTVVAMVLSIWCYCKYKQGRRLAYHIWKNMVLMLVFVILKGTLEARFPNAGWDFSYIMVYLPFPIWSFVFVFYPVCKYRTSSNTKNYDSTTLSDDVLSNSNKSYSGAIRSPDNSKVTELAIKKAEKNPARISKRMFIRLLNSKAGGEAFLKHMQSMFCGEIVLFYQDARNFEENRLRETMELIMRTYIGDDAPLEVNLPADIVNMINEKSLKKNPDPTIFHEAQEECRKLMKSNMANKFRFPQEAWEEALQERKKQRDRFKTSFMSSFAVNELISLMKGPEGVKVQDHYYQMSTYDACFTGSDCVEWMIENKICMHQNYAIRKAQELLACGSMIHVLQDENKESSESQFECSQHSFYRWNKDYQMKTTPMDTPVLINLQEEEIPSESSEESTTTAQIEMVNIPPH